MGERHATSLLSRDHRRFQRSNARFSHHAPGRQAGSNTDLGPQGRYVWAAARTWVQTLGFGVESFCRVLNANTAMGDV